MAPVGGGGGGGGGGVVELTMMDLSVVRPSMAPSDASDSSLTLGNRSSTAPNSNNKTNDKATVDFNKLRGKARVAAINCLEEIVSELPRLEDEQAKARESLSQRMAAIDRILQVFKDDAHKLPLDALGDFNVVATNPVPFAEALERSVQSYELRSPDRKSHKTLPDNLGKKLKTSATLNRATSKNTSAVSNVSNTSNKSSKVSGSTLKATGAPRAPSKSRTGATPLSGRTIKKAVK